MEHMTVGFIGFGNMAQAMADGFLRAGVLSPGQLCACARSWEKLLASAGARGIRALASAEEVAKQADVVIVAVKPWQVEAVLTPIKEILREKALVSVAVNLLYDEYEMFLAPGSHHLSILPNTPVAVGEGILICEEKHSLTESQMEQVTALLSSLGLVETVDAAHMGIAGTLSGCGPAFAAQFVEALADAAVLHGLSRQAAYRLASQMMAGTGKLQLDTGAHPASMKDAVCSPGGTTIAGVTALEKNGFRGAVIEGIDAIMERSAAMARKSSDEKGGA